MKLLSVMLYWALKFRAVSSTGESMTSVPVPFSVNGAVWNVPHRQNPNFTGRAALLEAIHSAFRPTSGRLPNSAVAITQAIAGLDAVGLDLPLLVALQGRLMGEFSGREGVAFHLPARIPPEWGVQRLKNLIAAWRDQLLEILGAMGLREVRRLRGEMGRALFMVDLEREAFAEIEGYDA
ncbi:MAG: hypothetical protein ACK2UW_02900 [Anaerolineales bacterium]